MAEINDRLKKLEERVSKLEDAAAPKEQKTSEPVEDLSGGSEAGKETEEGGDGTTGS